MSRLIKKKIVFYTLRGRTFKYTEILEEVIRQTPIETIDLTTSDDENDNNGQSDQNTDIGTPNSTTTSFNSANTTPETYYNME